MWCVCVCVCARVCVCTHRYTLSKLASSLQIRSTCSSITVPANTTRTLSPNNPQGCCHVVWQRSHVVKFVAKKLVNLELPHKHATPVQINFTRTTQNGYLYGIRSLMSHKS